MADNKHDTAGQVVWEPGKAAPVATRSPVEAAAFLAGQLAAGHVKAVHVTIFTEDGRMARAIFGEMYLPMLVWMAAYVQRDALLLNDSAAAVPGAQFVDPATGKPKTP